MISRQPNARCSIVGISGCFAFALFAAGSLCAHAEMVVAEKPPPARRGGHAETGATKTNVPPPVISARTADSLTLLNGDRLQGRLVGVDGSGVVTWQHKAMLEPLHCSLAALDKVDLLPRKSEGIQHHRQLVRLINGDRLSGDVVTLDATQLVLRTWYAGTLNIARPRLAALTPGVEQSHVLYEGPTADLTGWSKDEADQSGPAPFYRHGALVLPGGRNISRAIAHLPDQVRFDLELGAWQETMFSFVFFADDPGGAANDAYGVTFASSTIDFHRTADEERSLGSADISEQLARRRHLPVSILADRKKRYFALLVDGRLVREFRDAKEFTGKGQHISFLNNSGTNLRIYKLIVSAWNGRLPRTESETEAIAGQDLLTLVNGDTIAGAARSIAQGSAQFETTYGALAVPLERIATLRFANPAAPTNGTVRCWFNEQDAVTLALEKIAADSISGSAAGIGALKLPLGALTRLEFNPTTQRNSSERDDDEL